MSRSVNIELAEKVLKQVTEHPETHEQLTWGYRTPCGTTACLAGWTVVFGALPVYRAECGERAEFGDLIRAAVDSSSEEGFVDDVAAELLGMDEETASSIFFAPNRVAISLFEEWLEEAKTNAAASA